jgi:hypothetical protein
VETSEPRKCIGDTLLIREEKVREVVKIIDEDHCAFEGTKIAAAGSENDGDQLRVEEVMPSRLLLLTSILCLRFNGLPKGAG